MFEELLEDIAQKNGLRETNTYLKLIAGLGAILLCLLSTSYIAPFLLLFTSRERFSSLHGWMQKPMRNFLSYPSGLRLSVALLIAVWYVLQGKTDKYAEPEAVAQKMLKFAYAVGKANRPKGQTAAQFARTRMDALGLGRELTSIPWGSKKPSPLPPTGLKERSDVPNK